MGGFGNRGWKDARGWLYIHIGLGGVWDYRAVEKIGQEQHMKRKKKERKKRRSRERMSDGRSRDAKKKRRWTADGAKVLCVGMGEKESACGWACMFRYIGFFCLCAVLSDVDFFLSHLYVWLLRGFNLVRYVWDYIWGFHFIYGHLTKSKRQEVRISGSLLNSCLVKGILVSNSRCCVLG